MGMLGSETALEQLMLCVLEDLIHDGVVATIADDLYCGGETAVDLLQNWKKLLTALHSTNLGLSAPKTVIAPSSTTILGWIWCNGTLKASPHKVSTLSSCSLPLTVKGMRLFLGAYKFLSRVIPSCANFIGPLEALVGSKQSQERLDPSITNEPFQKAQLALSTSKSIVIPRPSDQLWIVMDGTIKNHGVASTLYVSRDGKIHLAGFFSAKLKKQQDTWIPCEIEALCIAASIKHFSPFIIQASTQTHILILHTHILTDSKPCVQAFEKLTRGQFSHSSQVSTFLSTASRYQVKIMHLLGSSNIPSDFACHNATPCPNPSCQICSFVTHLETAFVLRVSI